MTSTAEYAKSHGVHRTTVVRWGQRGLIAFNEGGSIDVARSDKNLSACSLGRFKMVQRADGLPSTPDIHLRKAYALMRKRELEVEAIENRLIDAAIARQEFERFTKLILNEISKIPERYARSIAEEIYDDLSAKELDACAKDLERALRIVIDKTLTEIRESLEGLNIGNCDA